MCRYTDKPQSPSFRPWLLFALLAPALLAACVGAKEVEGRDSAGNAATPGDGGTDEAPVLGLDARDPTPPADPPADAMGDASPDAGALDLGVDATAWITPACQAGAAKLCQKLFDCVPLFLEVYFRDVATCTERVFLSCQHE